MPGVCHDLYLATVVLIAQAVLLLERGPEVVVGWAHRYTVICETNHIFTNANVV